jgi:flagellar motor protein MotB
VDEVNTIENEIAPIWNYLPDSTVDFYFERSPSGYMNATDHHLYKSNVRSARRNNFWSDFSTPQMFHFPELSDSQYEVGPLWINQGNEDRYFVGCADRTNVNDLGNLNKANLRILSSTGELQTGNILAEKANASNSWQSHPSGNNKVIFFSSDRPGGKGGLDIWYVVEIKPNVFSEPINASDLNTPYDEAFPSVAPNDDRTLYFSSNRPREDSQKYGFDIYVAHRIFDTDEGTDKKVPFRFHAPTLLPSVNTKYNDISYVAMDDSTGFFASDRPRSKWDSVRNFDIYQVRPNPDTIPIDTKQVTIPPAINGCTGATIQATIAFTIRDIVSNRIVGEGHLEAGKPVTVNFFDPKLSNGIGIYQLYPEPMDAFDVMLPLMEVFEGSYRVDTLFLYERAGNPCPRSFKAAAFFDGGSADLTPLARQSLKTQIDSSVLPFLKKLPPGYKISFLIEGYTEGKATTYHTSNPHGDFSKNLELSEDRADTVEAFYKNYFAGSLYNTTYVVKGYGLRNMKTPYVPNDQGYQLPPEIPQNTPRSLYDKDGAESPELEQQANAENRRVMITITILPK